jgi:hypothetical protein
MAPVDVTEEEVDIEKEPVKSLNRNESKLDQHADPFAPRDGKTLVWRNVNMTLVCWA